MNSSLLELYSLTFIIKALIFLKQNINVCRSGFCLKILRGSTFAGIQNSFQIKNRALSAFINPKRGYFPILTFRVRQKLQGNFYRACLRIIL
jgi:hypothetical protein